MAEGFTLRGAADRLAYELAGELCNLTGRVVALRVRGGGRVSTVRRGGVALDGGASMLASCSRWASTAAALRAALSSSLSSSWIETSAMEGWPDPA